MLQPNSHVLLYDNPITQQKLKALNPQCWGQCLSPYLAVSLAWESENKTLYSPHFLLFMNYFTARVSNHPDKKHAILQHDIKT